MEKLPEKKIVYIDMDDTFVDFATAWKNVKRINPKTEYPQSNVGFFRNLVPFHNAIDTIKILEASGKYEVWFATAPSVHNIHCYSEKAESIRKHLGHDFLHRLIIIPDKGKLIGDYLIDDNHQGKGQDRFRGELIHFQTWKFPNWDSILYYLLPDYQERILLK